MWWQDEPGHTKHASLWRKRDSMRLVVVVVVVFMCKVFAMTVRIKTFGSACRTWSKIRTCLFLICLLFLFCLSLFLGDGSMTEILLTGPLSISKQLTFTQPSLLINGIYIEIVLTNISRNFVKKWIHFYHKNTLVEHQAKHARTRRENGLCSICEQ